MKFKIICEPNTAPLTWEEFCAKAPPGSIAIDGYVTGPLKWDPALLTLNLNHHEGCDRLSTRCTAAQAVMLLRSGLTKALEGLEEIRIYCNDCDQDVILTVWSLRNAFVSRTVINPAFNRILHIADVLDTTAGAYSFPHDMPGMEESNWIFEPYTIARLNGTLARRDAREFLGVIEAGCDRISHAVAGRGKCLPLDTRYDRIGGGTGWIHVCEKGLNARVGVFNDADAFVATRHRPDGNHDVSIGRKSIFIARFDIPEMLRRLNEIEGAPNDPWGGGDTIAGSPRSAGTAIPIARICEIVEDVVLGR